MWLYFMVKKAQCIHIFKPESNNENIEIYIPSNTAQSRFKPFPCNQLATKAQSFRRQIHQHRVRHDTSAQRFHMKPRLRVKFPTPRGTDDQIPSSPGRQRYQTPRICPSGGGGMLKLRFDRYINVTLQAVK